MSFIRFFILFCLVMLAGSINLHAKDLQLANYLGTGSSPKLFIELAEENGPKWKPFVIDYQGFGSIPSSTNPNLNWSPWNVKDDKGNYYGTIVLTSNGKTAAFKEYTGGKDGNDLQGIQLSFNANINAYQLTADEVHSGSAIGPFPDAPPALPAVYEGIEMPIVFSVAGPNIVNNQGDIITFKGIVRPSLEWNSQGQKLSIDDIDKMAEWGANVIRLDLNQNYWFESAPVTEKGSYKQIINAIVYYAIEKRMAVILDLHWTENGHQNSMANKDSVRFWKEVAKDYMNFGTVMFELFNEPEGIDKKTWLSGNDKYAGYQELCNAVREAGAKNICIVNGLDWGYDLSFIDDEFKLKGENIVYGSHPYNEKGSEEWTGPGKSFAENFKGVLGKFPIIFTEFGVNQASYFPTGYLKVYERILEYARQNHIHYTAFAWWVEDDQGKADVFPVVIQDWTGTPVNGGVLIHDDMQEHPPTQL